MLTRLKDVFLSKICTWGPVMFSITQNIAHLINYALKYTCTSLSLAYKKYTNMKMQYVGMYVTHQRTLKYEPLWYNIYVHVAWDSRGWYWGVIKKHCWRHKGLMGWLETIIRVSFVVASFGQHVVPLAFLRNLAFGTCIVLLLGISQLASNTHTYTCTSAYRYYTL